MTGRRQKTIQLRLALPEESRGEAPRGHGRRARTGDGATQSRKPGRDRAVDGGGVPEGEPVQGVEASPGKPWERRGRRHEGRRIAGLPAGTLASNSRTIDGGDVQAAAGEAGRDPKAGRRGAQAGHPDGAGEDDPAGGVCRSCSHDGTRRSPEHSYGFRPGRSAHQAVAAAQRHIAEGCRWVVDMDLEKFFDRVNHDRLMAKAAERITGQASAQAPAGVPERWGARGRAGATERRGNAARRTVVAAAEQPGAPTNSTGSWSDEAIAS